MPGIDSVSETPDEPHDERTAARNAKIGLILFAVYVVLYVSFVLLNAFSPHVMERRPVAGLNLAVLFGFFLIVAAFVLALLYGWLCRNDVVGERTSADTEASSAATSTIPEETP